MLKGESKKLKSYYDLRADEYEEVYEREDPVHRSELAEMSDVVRELLESRRVLELGCGTGYWTKVAAAVAESATAVDFSFRSIQLAKGKSELKEANFILADAFDLRFLKAKFSGGMMNFLLSHISRDSIAALLREFHSKLDKGSPVFVADNLYVPEYGGKLIEVENDVNTYKIRTLADGSEHRIMKNYFDRKELRKIFLGKSKSLKIHIGKFYWWLKYEI